MAFSSDDSPPTEAGPARRRAFSIGALGAACKSATYYIAVKANVARYTAQNLIVKTGKRNVADVLADHSHQSNDGAKRGFLMEIWHETAFNRDAVDKGSSYRAELVSGQLAADIRIFDENCPEQTLANAQVKTSSDRTRLNYKINSPKYDGMQKAVNAGMEDPARGTSSTLEYDGISSSPLSNEEAEAALKSGDPSKLLDPLAPNCLAAAGKAALTGAAGGAVVCAAVEVGQTLYQKGKMEAEDLERVGRAAAVGAGAGAVCGAVSTLVGSAPVGALAASMVATAQKIRECDDWSSGMHEAFVTMAGTAAGLVASGVASAALAPVGLGVVIPIAATMAASTVNGKTRQMLAARL